jgi:hypothetical protein
VFSLEPIHDWADEPGEFVSWEPSATSLAKAAEAPVSEVPVSYQQAQHLRAYREHTARGTQMARLTIPAWNIQGRCDIRLMTHVINAYLRRHDTYRSWFEFVDGPDGEDVVRRTLRSPKDIKYVATNRGVCTPDQWRDFVLSTPSPMEWGCFRFGIIQRPDHFTFFMTVDHVHVDAMYLGLAFVEIHMMYVQLAAGGAPIPLPEAGSYADYCVRQRKFTSALTVDSPQVRGWMEFTDRNNGTLPKFPLPLGDPSVPCEGDLMTVHLMDAEQSDAFESACTDAGARFLGGIFAAAAIAEHELTGNPTYHVITPTSTRDSQAEMMTTGWFTGTVPVSVDVVPESFATTVRSAQGAFDSNLPLAHVPFERVLELAGDHGVRKPDPGVPMISYMDGTLAPLSSSVVGEWDTLNGKIFSEMGAANQIGMWFNRFHHGTSVTVAFPNNPIALESVTRYMDALKSVFTRVAAGRGELAPVGDLVDLRTA